MNGLKDQTQAVRLEKIAAYLKSDILQKAGEQLILEVFEGEKWVAEIWPEHKQAQEEADRTLGHLKMGLSPTQQALLFREVRCDETRIRQAMTEGFEVGFALGVMTGGWLSRKHYLGDHLERIIGYIRGGLMKGGCLFRDDEFGFYRLSTTKIFWPEHIETNNDALNAGSQFAGSFTPDQKKLYCILDEQTGQRMSEAVDRGFEIGLVAGDLVQVGQKAPFIIGERVGD